MPSSGHEDDFQSVDFVEEIPTEVSALKPVSPEQDLPSDAVENQATTEGINRSSGKTQLANEGSAGNDEAEQSEEEDITEHNVKTRTQRQRSPPQN